MTSSDSSSSKRGRKPAGPPASGADRSRSSRASSGATSGARSGSGSSHGTGASSGPPRRRRWLHRLRLVAEVGCAAAAFTLTLLWASLPDVAPLAKRPPATTAFIELRRDQAAAAKRPFELKWQWRRLDQISQYLRATVIFAEDLHFYDHDGVDWGALEKAAQSNYQRGTFSIGGSTITQQLAKNLFLSPSRSLLRKAREILIAGRLEEAMDKPRILELYLNVVEWGDGIFGAEAAARHWFGRSARQLTPLQAARLAAALPNPFTRTPRVRTAALQRKVARILWELRRAGLINRAQHAAAALEGGLPPPPSAIQPLDELPPELREAAGLDEREDEADRDRAAEGARPGDAANGASGGASNEARDEAPSETSGEASGETSGEAAGASSGDASGAASDNTKNGSGGAQSGEPARGSGAPADAPAAPSGDRTDDKSSDGAGARSGNARGDAVDGSSKPASGDAGAPR